MQTIPEFNFSNVVALALLAAFLASPFLLAYVVWSVRRDVRRIANALDRAFPPDTTERFLSLDRQPDHGLQEAQSVRHSAYGR
jgi:hypothetical protein